MFNIAKYQDTYTWTVDVVMPNKGKFEKVPVKVKFNRLDHDERTSLMSRLSEVENVGPEEARELEDEFFARVFAGWEAGQISNGDEALEDTPENRAAVLSISEFRMALIAGYFKSFGGDAKKPSSFTR